MEFGWVLLLVAIVVVLFLAFATDILVSIVGFFVKAGVAAKESQRPPHVDTGDYRLDQGREVRDERRPE